MPHRLFRHLIVLAIPLIACITLDAPTPYPTHMIPTIIAATSAAAQPSATTPATTVTPQPTVTPTPPSPTATDTPAPTPSPSPPPHFTQTFIIGYSVEGRPLTVYRFGTGAEARLIVAGIHGGSEWNTIALAEELIEYIRAHPEIIPPHISLYILPNLNPDGEARAHGFDGRANAHSVDLNRNWPYRWQADWDRTHCWNKRHLTAGDAPASEPETQALMRFIRQIHPTALISYHSAALGVFPGGVPPFPPSVRLAQALAEAGGYRYPPVDTGCDYTGNLTDWASSVEGIPAADIELTNHTLTDFEQNLRVLNVFLQWEP